jgi:hypothetical protein
LLNIEKLIQRKIFFCQQVVEVRYNNIKEKLNNKKAKSNNETQQMRHEKARFKIKAGCIFSPFKGWGGINNDNDQL